MWKWKRNKAVSSQDALQWVSRAVTHSQAGDYEQAYEAYQRAFELEPTSVPLHYNWALTALRRGDRPRIAECAVALMSAAPEDWRTPVVRAYLAELSNEIQSGWELCRSAYAQARSKGDGEELAAATADVLWFACRNRLQDQADEVVRHVFEEATFNESILDALRKLFGQPSGRAVDYGVLVEGAFSNPAFPESSRYVRSYRVLAEGEEEAGRMALEFEARCGEKDLRVVSVEKKSEACEGQLGVWWRLQAQVIS